jgi:hypothetical protein
MGVRVELRLPPQVGLGQGLSATPYIKGGGQGERQGTPRPRRPKPAANRRHLSPASAPDCRLLLTAIRCYRRIIVIDVIYLSLSPVHGALLDVYHIFHRG